MSQIGTAHSNLLQQGRRVSPVRTISLWPLTNLALKFPNLRQHIANLAAANMGSSNDLIIEQSTAGFRSDCFEFHHGCVAHVAIDDHVYIPVDPNPGGDNILDLLGLSEGNTELFSSPVEVDIDDSNVDVTDIEANNVSLGNQGLSGSLPTHIQGVCKYADVDEYWQIVSDANNNPPGKVLVVGQMDNGDIVAQFSRQ